MAANNVGQINMNTPKEPEINPAITQTKAPETISDTTQAPPTDTTQAPFTGTPEVNVGPKRHHIVYIANGVWTDAKGVAWSTNEKKGVIREKTFSDSEYRARPDIEFMVGYGAMRHTEI